jgi:CheY-like chemotaxis protein
MSKTILCVDDSATMQTVCEITLRATDFQYVGARSAQEGLEKARSSKPDLVLVDAIMPDKTGYDLCQSLKAELGGVPVVMMCGNSSAYDESRGAAVGCDGHVVKPWDSAKLLEQLGSFLSQARPASDSRRQAAAPKPAFAPAAAPAAANRPTPISRPSPAPARPTPAPRPMPAAPAPVARPQTPVPSAAPASHVRPTPAPAARPGPPSPAPRPASAAARPTPRPGPPPGPVPVAAPPTPAPAPVAAGPAGINRPPMLKGVPTKRPATQIPPPGRKTAPRSATLMGMQAVQMPPLGRGSPKPPGVTSISARRPAAAAPAAEVVPPPAQQQVATKLQDALPIAAANVARAAGLDPGGPEMAALVKLSREVIEQVVWEVVPDLAETIIRENLDRLASPK